MSEINEDLSIQIMNALKHILPKGVGFIMVCGKVSDGQLSITCNLPDDLATEFLNGALSTIEVQPAILLEPDPEELN